MTRFTFIVTRSAVALATTTLLSTAAFAQLDQLPADDLVTPAGTGMLVDTDGDGILNHEDEDFARPDFGRGNRMGPADFIDADGDGINDLAPDADGDGIVNHLDADYVRPANADGSTQGRGMRGSSGARNSSHTLGNGECVIDNAEATSSAARRQVTDRSARATTSGRGGRR